MGNIMDFRASLTFPQAAGAMCGLLCVEALALTRKAIGASDVCLPSIEVEAGGGFDVRVIWHKDSKRS